MVESRGNRSTHSKQPMGIKLPVRHCTVSTKASFTEQDFWRDAAHKNKQSLSDWVRDILNREVGLDD